MNETFQTVKKDLANLLDIEYNRNIFLTENNKVKIDKLIAETATELVNLVEPKKSELPCNCCNEEIDAQQKLMQVVEAVDNFTTAINKLANQKKF